MPLVDWTPQFDITSVPDAVLLAESARRLRARQRTAPRPKIKRPCAFCQELFGAREMRKHLPLCPRRHETTPAIRSGWALKRITDLDEQRRETYRYWQSRSIGERLAAVWDATEAAYSVKKTV